MNKAQQKSEFQLFCSSAELAEKLHFYFSKQFFGELTESKKCSIAILAELQSEKIRASYEKCIRENYSAENIILLAPQNSMSHRTFSMETKCTLFIYDNEEKFSELPIFANSILQKLTAALIAKEIEHACTFGALSMLTSFLEIDFEEQSERARFAGALAIAMNYDLDFIKRTAKLALFYEITSCDHWNKIVKNTKDFWNIQALLSELAAFRQEANIFSPNLPEEIILVEVAKLLCSSGVYGEQDFYTKLKDRTAQLPFKIKTNLRMGVEKTFAQVWEKKNVAA